MKKIAVFTSTRAEYGLLRWLLKRIAISEMYQLDLLVSGTHLSTEHGNTVRFIEEDGFSDYISLPYLSAGDDFATLIRDQGKLSSQLSDYFEKVTPDLLVLLGDRYELLTVAQAATIARVPIMHIHGGESTQGAIDDSIRHAITKLSHLHCASTEQYAHRIVQMGEHPDTVINCGALGLETLDRIQFSKFDDFKSELPPAFPHKYFVIAFHPETQLNNPDISPLLSALDRFSGYGFILIRPNSDEGNGKIFQQMSFFVDRSNSSRVMVASLSHSMYLSYVASSCALIGNSSSGIIEVPSLGVPTVNIGNRQEGRVSADSVINCELNCESIVVAIQSALGRAKNTLQKNPYYKADPSKNILDFIDKRIDGLVTRKDFYDIGE